MQMMNNERHKRQGRTKLNIKLRHIKSFILHTDGSGNCWIWQSTVEKSGYGRIKVNTKNVLAHRFAYELFIGDIPDGLVLDHLCRNRKCVNPAHLEPITQKQNCIRGNTGLHNAIRTECVKGHIFSGVNINGKRICHTCNNISSKECRLRRIERVSKNDYEVNTE